MEATAGQKRKAKNKQWFKGQKRRKFTLCPDIKGFLCFCNYKEKEAIREAYNILNQYYEAEEVVKEETAATEDVKEEEDDDDIDAQLAKEKSELDREASSEELRRFQVVESGVNNVLFIRTQVPDPLALVTKILEGIKETKKQVTRHLIRMLPVQATCKAYDQNVRPAVQALVDEFVAARQSESTTYQVKNTLKSKWW